MAPRDHSAGCPRLMSPLCPCDAVPLCGPVVASALHGQDLTGARHADIVHPRAVPMIVEVPALARVMPEIRKEETDAEPAGKAAARIENAVRPAGAQRPSERLARVPPLRVERRRKSGIAAREVVKAALDRQQDLAELRCPARRLPRPRHE